MRWYIRLVLEQKKVASRHVRTLISGPAAVSRRVDLQTASFCLQSIKTSGNRGGWVGGWGGVIRGKHFSKAAPDDLNSWLSRASSWTPYTNVNISENPVCDNLASSGGFSLRSPSGTSQVPVLKRSSSTVFAQRDGNVLLAMWDKNTKCAVRSTWFLIT